MSTGDVRSASSPSVPRGQTKSALHEAITSNNLRTVMKLIATNPNLLDERNEKQQTALHIAALNNNSDILEWLLAARANRVLKSLLDINAVDCEGNSALHSALSVPHLKPALLLLKNDASPFLPNYFGRTAIFSFFLSAKHIAIDHIQVKTQIHHNEI